MTSQLWLVAGLLLMLLEFVVPGFVIIFFGVGAALVGLLLWLFPGMSEMTQIVLLPALSLVCLAVFRRFFVSSVSKKYDEKGTNFDDNDCNGKVVKVVEPIQPGMPGKVELNGVNWSASCAVPVPAGRNVRIISRTGLTFVVEPAEA